MADSLKRLIESGDVDQFNSELRDYDEEDEDYPSLQTETFEELEIAGFDFSDLDFSYAEFGDVTCTDVRFDRTTLDGAYAHGSTFIDCYFDETAAQGLALDSCTFAKCEFDGVDFDDPEWTDCQFTECDFEDVSVDGGSIERTTFTEGDWKGMAFDGTDFTLVTLRGVPFGDLAMERCSAKNCYVTGGTQLVDELPAGFIEKTGRRRRME